MGNIEVRYRVTTISEAETLGEIWVTMTPVEGSQIRGEITFRIKADAAVGFVYGHRYTVEIKEERDSRG